LVFFFLNCIQPARISKRGQPQDEQPYAHFTGVVVDLIIIRSISFVFSCVVINVISRIVNILIYDDDDDGI